MTLRERIHAACIDGAFTRDELLTRSRRPEYVARRREVVRDLLAKGHSVRSVAREFGLDRSTIYHLAGRR